MKIENLRLNNFRNYSDQSVSFSPGINVIAGENAQGKTSLLESVFFLSCGHSFRTRFDRELINFGETNARLRGEIFSDERIFRLDIALGGGKKKLLCNEVPVGVSELSNVLRVVLFSPDDLNMIKDGAIERRRFMDTAISQLRPNYAALMSEYNRLYEHKKRILCDWREKPSLLDTLDEFSAALCRLSAQIIRYRAAYVERLCEIAPPIHGDFSGSGETLEMEYKTVSTVKNPLAPVEDVLGLVSERQAELKDAEMVSGSILVGIHKDDIEIKINGVSARAFASQGQARTASLSLKMAEREISRSDTGETPVLLLDDVLSELDLKRQEYVLNRIGGGQTLITCCEDEQIKKRTGGRLMTVSAGKITEN